jgi:RNA polymerase sigma factor (sigma-70 family)
MHDPEIVAAISAGDPAGLAAAYDEYAQGLFFYCKSLLAEPADAADAVQNTFIVAAAKVAGLREPGRLRSWLYAVARNECHRRLRAHASTAPLDEAAETSDDTENPEADAEQAELRALVRAALGGLNPGEREIIELNLRHELDGADLADALGVPRNQAHALASRARSQFETSLGVLLVARSGPEDCPELASILDGWDGELTVLIRKRVSRHIGRCEVCGERKRRQLSPASLLSLLPVAALPASLREQVVHLLADVTQGSLAYRARVVHRAEPFAGSGFPAPSGPPAVGRPLWGHHAGRAVGATAAAGALIGGALFLVPHHAGTPAVAGQPPGSAGVPGAGPQPSAHRSSGSASGTSAGGSGGSPASRSGVAVPSAHPGPTVPGTGPPPAPAIPVPAGSSPGGSSSSGSSAAAPSAAPAPIVTGTLLVSPTSIQVGLTITLTAEGGPVSYTISAPAVLAVSPASGSLQAGQSVSVSVGLALGQVLDADTTLTIDPGPVRVTVLPPALGLLQQGL